MCVKLLKLCRPFSWLMLLLLPAICVQAQPQYHPFKHYTIEDGLSLGSSNVIVQDSVGFYWVGTQDGLNRFDGYHWRIIPLETSYGLFSGFVNDLLACSDSSIWIGAREGLFVVKPGEESAVEVPLNNSGNQNTISALAALPAATIAAAVGSQIWLVRNNERTKVELPPVASSNTTAKTMRQRYVLRMFYLNNYLWVVDTYGLYRLRLGNNKAAVIAEGNFSDALPDEKGNIWIADKTYGLFKLSSQNIATQRFQTELKSDQFENTTFLTYDKFGYLWVGSHNGLHRYNTTNGQHYTLKRYVSDPYSLGSNSIGKPMIDNEARLWLPSLRGVSYTTLETANVEQYRHVPYRENSLSGSILLGMTVDADSNLWIGSFTEGLTKFHLPSGKMTQNPLNIPPKETHYAVLSDSKKNLWVGTNTALYRKDEAGKIDRFTPLQTHKSTASINYSCLLELPDNKLLIGSYDAGIAIYNYEEKSFSQTSIEDGLSSNAVRHVVQAADGTLWVATQGSGLDRILPDGSRVINYSHHASTDHTLSTNYLTSLYLQNDSLLWIGTETGGLNLLNISTGMVKRYGLTHGLSSGTIYGILNDSTGRLWMSTNNGINYFDPVTEKGSSIYETAALQGKEYNRLSYAKLYDDRMAFGGMKGLNIIDPIPLVANHTEPLAKKPIFLYLSKSGKADSKDAVSDVLNPAISTELILDNGFNGFSAGFSTLSPESPNHYYRWKLEPYTEQWSALSQQNNINYTNLQPGEYQLHIQATDNQQQLSAEKTILAITVLPLWHQKLWVRLLIVPLLAIALYYFIKFRLRQVKEQNLRLENMVQERTVALAQQKEQLSERNRQLGKLNEEKNHLMAILAHDLRNPLSQIKGLVNLMQMPIPEDERKQMIGMVQNSTERMQRMISQLLSVQAAEQKVISIQRQELNVAAVVKAVCERYTEALEEANLMLIQKHNFAKLPAQTDQNLLEQIIDNLLSNAIKYTPSEKKICITTGLNSNKKPCISIADEGPGFTEDDKKRMFGKFQRLSAKPERGASSTGMGLSIVKHHAELLDIHIEVVSEQGKGSTFTLTLPAPDGVKLQAKNKLESVPWQAR